MQSYAVKNLSALALITCTPYFIYGEYFFYACLCFSGGIYMMVNNFTVTSKQLQKVLNKQGNK